MTRTTIILKPRGILRTDHKRRKGIASVKRDLTYEDGAAWDPRHGRLNLRIWARGAATSTPLARPQRNQQDAEPPTAGRGNLCDAARRHEEIRWRRRVGRCARRKRKGHGFSVGGGWLYLFAWRFGKTARQPTRRRRRGAGVVRAGPARQSLVLLKETDIHPVNRLLGGDTRAAQRDTVASGHR